MKLRSDSTLVQRGYRIFAPFYDFVFGASLQPGRRSALRSFDCRPGERILEVCVGTGLSLPLYPPHVRVTGIDLSREMLRRAAARVATLRLLHVEALLQMDAERLAFADGSFDKVAIMYAISGLANPVRAVSEIRRVCRPGGTIVIANHFRSDGPLLRLCEELLSPVYRLLRYRANLDLDALLDATRLEVTETRRTNLFGYATLLVCANRPTAGAGEPEDAGEPLALATRRKVAK